MNSLTLGRSRVLAVGLALAALILIVACGSGDRAGVRSQDLAPPEQQVLRLRLTGEPKTIDPHLSNTVSETTLSKPLFAGLVTYDEYLNVVANLATEMPTVDNGGLSEDGLTYTIKLDKNAKWSDGKPVTANDFVYSMKRALDPKLAGPYELSAGELAVLRDGVGIRSKDEYTVVYRLRQPNPSFLNHLALWTAFPVRQDVVETHGDRWTEAGNHIGNGAFMLTEWAHDERIVFEPNPYWSGEKPKLTRLVINFIADDAAAFAAYLNGEIDSVVVPPALRREVLTLGTPLNAELIRAAELNTYAVFMNNERPPLDNVKVRQAIGMAVDREAYVEGVPQGGGRVTTSWLPPGMPGQNVDVGKQYKFDPAKAKQLLTEAGYPDGKGLPEIVFLWVARDTNRVAGQFVEDQLERNLGISVTSEYVDKKAYGAMLTGRDYMALVQRWSADWPYLDNWLPDLFGTGAGNNYGNAEFDALVARAAVETDEGKRLAIYNQAHKLAIDEAALMPLYNRELFLLVKPRVRDLIATGIDGAIRATTSSTRRTSRRPTRD